MKVTMSFSWVAGSKRFWINAGAIVSVTLLTGFLTPFPLYTASSSLRSSNASCLPVDAPERPGTPGNTEKWVLIYLEKDPTERPGTPGNMGKWGLIYTYGEGFDGTAGTINGDVPAGHALTLKGTSCYVKCQQTDVAFPFYHTEKL